MGIGAISSKELTELDLGENLGELCDVQISVINVRGWSLDWVHRWRRHVGVREPRLMHYYHRYFLQVMIIINVIK